jgi:hypothetical protein
MTIDASIIAIIAIIAIVGLRLDAGVTTSGSSEGALLRHDSGPEELHNV